MFPTDREKALWLLRAVSEVETRMVPECSQSWAPELQPADTSFSQDQSPSHNLHLNCTSREPFRAQHTTTERRPIARVNLSGRGYEAQLGGPLWLTLGHTPLQPLARPAARSGQSCNTPATEQPPSWRGGAAAATHYRFGTRMSGFTVNNTDQPIDCRCVDPLMTCRLGYLVFGGCGFGG
jgi:hypothetical protein